MSNFDCKPNFKAIHILMLLKKLCGDYFVMGANVLEINAEMKRLIAEKHDQLWLVGRKKEKRQTLGPDKHF